MSLTDRVIRQTRKPGIYSDANGLRLQVTFNNNTGKVRRSWLVRYTAPNGKLREMGLGTVELVSLAEARDLARQARKAATQGRDPIVERQAGKAEARTTAATHTFKECAEAFIEARKPGWKNAKHAAQWTATLDTYVYPVFGDQPVDTIDLDDVLTVLEPIWNTKTETATRIRGRMENILDWAAVRGYRPKDNPARWRGHLQMLLSTRSKAQRVKHHPALPFDDVPEFMQRLRAMRGLSRLAFEFLILTVVRTSNVLEATWDEIDLKKAVWTIPAHKMKTDKEHRVPLSRRAVEILATVSEVYGDTGLVFPGAKRGMPLSVTVFQAVLDRMGNGDVTPHGFRSTFRDWTSESTEVPHQVAEAALAHVIGNKAEAAYRRGDLFQKRRLLMEAWSEFCDGAQNVVPVDFNSARRTA